MLLLPSHLICGCFGFRQSVHFATKLLIYFSKFSLYYIFSIKKLTHISYYKHFDRFCFNSEAKVWSLLIICNYRQKYFSKKVQISIRNSLHIIIFAPQKANKRNSKPKE